MITISEDENKVVVEHTFIEKKEGENKHGIGWCSSDCSFDNEGICNAPEGCNCGFKRDYVDRSRKDGKDGYFKIL